ncbi:hypothetical protein HPP92_008712 [Vanilla planifolia]|uniref:Cytochrome P450 n=1 Tax=Vanilla planifolia TaxID=51239 RepID=A0A835RI98_VANPL|nr:hypothetical protein HPP92_008712 [Vanilla planifolia]
METVHLILLLLGLLFFAVIYSSLFYPSKKKKRLPPGPPAFPIVGNLHWLRVPPSLPNVEAFLRDLTHRLGPIVTIHVGPKPSIFIADRALAHKALVELGASFASRPPPAPASRFLDARVLNISSSPYGSIWRNLRRNLTSEILHPAKIRLFSDGRRWVLGLLLQQLKSKSQKLSDDVVDVKESFQFAMFCLLVLMCFGERLDERSIRDIEAAQRDILLYSSKYLRVFALLPNFLSKIVFRNRLNTVRKLRQRQSDIFLPLIRARRVRLKMENKEGCPFGRPRYPLWTSHQAFPQST